MTKRITLTGIKRRGLVEWKGREWWSRQQVVIWSREHRGWWREEAKGYTSDPQLAWIIDFPTAYDYTKHCGPEKKIVFYVADGAYARPTVAVSRPTQNSEAK